MSLSLEIQAIGDELVEAFSEHRLASRLDFILERLDAAAERAAALEAGPAKGFLRKELEHAAAGETVGASAVVIDFVQAWVKRR